MCFGLQAGLLTLYSESGRRTNTLSCPVLAVHESDRHSDGHGTIVASFFFCTFLFTHPGIRSCVYGPTVWVVLKIEHISARGSNTR